LTHDDSKSSFIVITFSLQILPQQHPTDTSYSSFSSSSTMTSTSPTNGRIILHGMTTVKNRRQIPGKPYSYVYDGLFSCADPPESDEDGVASLRYFVGKDPNMKQDGTYELYAKVGMSIPITEPS
jgi:hypothetical protein